MWLYTVLRVALFLALWGIVWLVGARGLLAAGIALVLSIPLSYVLLARPRAAFAVQIEQRLEAQRLRRAEFDAQLDPTNEQPDDPAGIHRPDDPR
jgi:O-antigen ligase